MNTRQRFESLAVNGAGGCPFQPINDVLARYLPLALLRFPVTLNRLYKADHIAKKLNTAVGITINRRVDLYTTSNVKGLAWLMIINF